MVTGAASGIGRQTALTLSHMGARVALVDRNAENLHQVKSELEGSGHSAFEFDLLDFSAYPKLFAAVTAGENILNGLVHCAGIARPIPLQSIRITDLEQIMGINYYAFLMLVQQYAKKKFSRGGSIVTVSAVNSHYPKKCMTVYAGSKRALEGAVSTLALELSPKEIRVNTVIAGAIDTPLSREALDSDPSIEASQLLGLGKPQDISNAILFLLSDASRFITGRHLFVDGGRL